MSEYQQKSGFKEVGDPTVVHENRHPDTGKLFWDVRQQNVEFINTTTGQIKARGAMFYGHMQPGSLIVAVRGDSKEGHVLLIPQERFTTNLIDQEPSTNHYELPGGGIDEEKNEKAILAAAEKELAEEAGYSAEEFRIIGNPERGLMPHPYLTDHNITVLALHAYELDLAIHEESESIGSPEWPTWDETDAMAINPKGLWTPEGYKIISSEPTFASLNLVQKYLRIRELAQEGRSPVHIDLGAMALANKDIDSSR